jgi:hypothetical protein
MIKEKSGRLYLSSDLILEEWAKYNDYTINKIIQTYSRKRIIFDETRFCYIQYSDFVSVDILSESINVGGILAQLIQGYPLYGNMDDVLFDIDDWLMRAAKLRLFL